MYKAPPMTVDELEYIQHILTFSKITWNQLDSSAQKLLVEHILDKRQGLSTDTTYASVENMTTFLTPTQDTYDITPARRYVNEQLGDIKTPQSGKFVTYHNLSPNLRTKAQNLTDRPERERTKFWDAPTISNLLLSTISTTAFVTGVVFLVIALFTPMGIVLPGLLMLCAGLAIVTPDIANVVRDEISWRKSPQYVSRKDRATIEAARIEYDFSDAPLVQGRINKDSYEYRYHGVVTRDKVSMRNLSSVDQHKSRYVSTILLVRELATRIRSNPAWQSDYLDNHRARLDLFAEEHAIVQGCGSLSAMERKIGKRPEGDEETVQRAQKVWDSQRQTLVNFWDSIMDRIAALYDYEQHLNNLARQLAALTSLEAAMRVQVEIEDFAAMQMMNEIATAEITSLTDEIETIKDAMYEVLGIMHHDVLSLSSASPKVIEA